MFDELKALKRSNVYFDTSIQNTSASADYNTIKEKVISIYKSIAGSEDEITEETELNKKDIVLCKVKGHYYLHLIHSIKTNKKGSSYLIGNNHGHMNGWISRIIN